MYTQMKDKLEVLKAAEEADANIDEEDLAVLAACLDNIRADWCFDGDKKLIEAYELVMQQYLPPAMMKWYESIPRGKYVEDWI